MSHSENGDFIRFYHQYVDMVYRVCFMLLKNKEDTEDAVQHVFTTVIEKKILFHNEAHEKAWLIVASKNYCKNQLKHWSRKNIEFEEKVHASIYENESNEILELVLKLPQRYKLPIYLYYYEQYSSNEIADILKVNASTIRSRLKKGRVLLRKECMEDINESR